MAGEGSVVKMWRIVAVLEKEGGVVGGSRRVRVGGQNPRSPPRVYTTVTLYFYTIFAFLPR